MEEEKKYELVPYVAYESALARQDRHIKHLFIALIVAIVLIFVSNGVWLYCWMQYDYTTETYTIESQDGGNANFIGNDGDIHNGENNDSANSANKENEQLP